MVEAFSPLAEGSISAYGVVYAWEPPNKKLSGRGKGVDGGGNFSRMFQKAYTPAKTFFGPRKRHASLRRHLSEGKIL